MIPTVDGNLQLQPGWAYHLNSDGSQIAPPGTPDPSKFGMTQVIPNATTAAMFSMTGPKFACVEWYIKRQVQAAASKLVLSFNLTPGADFVKNAWIKETDTIIVLNKKKYNLSVQRIMATNAIQISDQNGNWADTGTTAPAFVPAIPLKHEFTFGLNFTKGTYAMQAMNIGGFSTLINYSLQGLTATDTTWADGLYFQNQDQIGVDGGVSQSYFLDNVMYVWS